MAVNTTTTTKAKRTFKGGSSPITQRVETAQVGSPIPYTITTPLKFPSTVGETFKTTANITEGVVDNFKNMLLTNYGERLGKPDYGANLSSLLSERLSNEDWLSRATTTIRNTTQKYMPFLTIESINAEELQSRNDGFSRVQLTIIYSILVLGVQNRRLNLTLTNMS